MCFKVRDKKQEKGDNMSEGEEAVQRIRAELQMDMLQDFNTFPSTIANYA